MQDNQAGPPSDNLFVTGLPEGLQDDQLKDVFAAYGEVVSVRGFRNPGKTSALVRYSSVEEAQWVVDNLNGNIPQDLETPVLVRFAHKPAGGPPAGAGGGRPSPYPGGGGGGWAAVQAAATRKGGGKGTSAMRTFIKGMESLGALPGKVTSDQDCLVIGGLPPDCTTQDLYSLFAPFGAIPVNGVKAVLGADGSCTGTGYINFTDSASVAAATQLNGVASSSGRTLQVSVKKSMASMSDPMMAAMADMSYGGMA